MNKLQLKQDYTAAGVWDRFVKLRDKLKKHGLTPTEARDRAKARIDAYLAKRQQPRTPGREEYERLKTEPWGKVIIGLMWVELSLVFGDQPPGTPTPSPAESALLAWAKETPDQEAVFRTALRLWKDTANLAADPDQELDRLLDVGGEHVEPFLGLIYDLAGLPRPELELA